MKLLFAFVLALALTAAAGPAGAQNPAPPGPSGLNKDLPGPVPASVLKVIDGDTLMVRARIWVRQDVDIRVRIIGIDTPELRGTCESERELARKARELTRSMTSSGTVRLFAVRDDKYGGRVLARVETDDGRDIAAALMEAGLARPYDGGRRAGWCR